MTLTSISRNKDGKGIPSSSNGGGFAGRQLIDADVKLPAAVDPDVCYDCGGPSTGGYQGLCLTCIASAPETANVLDSDDVDDDIGFDDGFDDELELEAVRTPLALPTVAAEFLKTINMARSVVKAVDVSGEYIGIDLEKSHPQGGFSHIKLFENGAVAGFFADFHEPSELSPNGTVTKTLLHREDGPAFINSSDGAGMIILAGQIQSAPDDTGFTFDGVDEDGTQTWSSGTGNRVATRKANGDMLFKQDGDIDRVGAPAMTVDGVDTWWRHDKQIEDPRPRPTITTTTGAPGHETTQFVGAKYKVQDAKTTAALIRTDIRNAQYAGILPDNAVYRVRSEAGRNPGVSISVEGADRDALNPNREEPGEPWYTDEGKAWSETLNGFADQYNYWEEGQDASHSRRHLQTSVGFASANLLNRAGRR